MMNSHEDKTKNASRRSGSSRASTTRKSHRSSSRKSGGSKGGGSRSPNRSGEPRRSKRSKEDLEAKEKARAQRESGNDAGAELVAAVDHTDGAPNSRNKQRKSNRRSQQDRGIAAKDAKAKVKDLLNRSNNEANTGPAPGAFADSRGDEVAKDQKSGNKGRFRRALGNEPSIPAAHADSRGDDEVIIAKDQKPSGNKERFRRALGTQSVFTTEERTRMETEDGQEQGELVVANTVDDSHDADLAMDFLNSVFDHAQVDETGKKKNKKTLGETKMSTDSSQESKDEENEESEGKDREKSKLKKGVRIFWYLLCGIAVLGAAGIGTWIALRDNNNSTMSDAINTKEPSSGGGPNVTTNTDTSAPSYSTDDPTITLNPSPNTATSAPSGAPNTNTGADVAFQPPSEEDCAAITNGGAVEGQDMMLIQSYLVDLDATSFLPMDLGMSAGIIEDKVRDLLTPALTGCDPRDVRRLWHGHRHLVDDFSYAIGNVMVDALGMEGVSCRDVSNPNCHRVRVTLNIVVKDESVKVAAVITELTFFFGGVILTNKLELAELYESVTVANLGPTDQTKSPSGVPDASPSEAPSPVSSPTLLGTPILTVSPSRSPTPVSTPLPTSAPVAQEKTLSPTTSSPPTPGPTPPPTPEPGPQGTPPSSLPPTSRPTPSPTPGPTQFPTPRPVSAPTFIPVADPTPSPSASPSEMPSTSPTNPPVVSTPFPSVTPSEIPSSDPTSGPSRTPSSQPSPNPTSGPTNRPSTFPSHRPSAAPSPGPVPISLSTNRCGYLESVLGNRASLHQLAFDWMCNMDTWEPSEEESYPEQWHDRYAVVAFLYGANDDDPDTFNYSQLSEASTMSTCSWLAGLQSSGNVIHTCLQTAEGSKVFYQNGGPASRVSGSKSPSGYVPSAIGLLTNLETLREVRMDRPLPSEIGLLTRLTYFRFDGSSNPRYSELGTIPTEIGLLTNLRDIFGQYSGLKGTIPSELMNLTALTTLALAINQLSGTIPPSIIGLTNLTDLRLQNNRLTGTVPPLPIEQFKNYGCGLYFNLFDDVTNGVSANCNT